MICGAIFQAPPSAKKVTCSNPCRRERARRQAQIRHVRWSEAARERRRKQAHRFRAALQQGTTAAQQSPAAGPFPTNQKALIWYLESPEGRRYTVRNLRLFFREHPELIPGNTMEQATHGIYVIKQSMSGTRKGRGAAQWKGWRLLGWEIPSDSVNIGPTEKVSQEKEDAW